MKYIYISIIICIIIFIIINHFNYFIKNYNNTVEHYCKIPPTNPQGTLNDKKVDLNDYKPQTDILTSSCDQYWKDWPLEVNNTMIEDSPVVINSDQLLLPKEKQFADNAYARGLIDFNKLADLIKEDVGFDPLKSSVELYIDPITKKKFEYDYELEYAYYERNKKTYINRWTIYNPSVKMYFKYDEIKSDIEDINILNKEFKRRIDIKQKELLNESQLILYGIVLFDIFKYKIFKIQYINSDINKPIYIIEIVLYRESDLYINTFSYIGWIRDSDLKPVITNVKYIGRNTTDNFLLSNFYNKNELKQQILNQNFDNTDLIEMDPDAILSQTKAHKEAFKLKNQYACFNMNYDPNNGSENILPYYSRQSCETNFDPYGRPKQVGVYDTPCKKDTDCPFFKANDNYENNFGKCQEDGYCELPINMERIGYRYFRNDSNKKPLCYNCKSDSFQLYSTMDTCCDEQYNTEKYGFLKSPDYAFDNDYRDRQNYFNQKYCSENNETGQITCKDM
jgi:hypothetical protein